MKHTIADDGDDRVVTDENGNILAVFHNEGCLKTGFTAQYYAGKLAEELGFSNSLKAGLKAKGYHCD